MSDGVRLFCMPASSPVPGARRLPCSSRIWCPAQSSWPSFWCCRTALPRCPSRRSPRCGFSLLQRRWVSCTPCQGGSAGSVPCPRTPRFRLYPKRFAVSLSSTDPGGRPSRSGRFRAPVSTFSISSRCWPPWSFSSRRRPSRSSSRSASRRFPVPLTRPSGRSARSSPRPRSPAPRSRRNRGGCRPARRSPSGGPQCSRTPLLLL